LVRWPPTTADQGRREIALSAPFEEAGSGCCRGAGDHFAIGERGYLRGNSVQQQIVGLVAPVDPDSQLSRLDQQNISGYVGRTGIAENSL
jgi:hypothetical protein